MHEENPLSASEQKSKSVLNTIVAALMSVMALWLAVADFSHHGDLLFQGSASLLLSVLLVSLLFILLIVVAALPKRIIIGANLLVLCRCAMGFPLNVWLGNTAASRVFSVAFLVVSLAYLAMSLSRMSRPSTRPWFQAKHSVISFLTWVVMGILTIPFWAAGYAYAAKNLVGDYAGLSTSQVTLTEKVFEKDGKHVHLVGMMHIGNDSYYTDLKQRMNADPAPGVKRLVLTEGVADRDHVIPQDFANGKTYARWAKLLGLETQKELNTSKSPTPPLGTPTQPDPTSNPNITWQNADIDVSDLQQHHRERLVNMLTLASSPNLAGMLTPNTRMTGAQVEDLIMNGLLKSRNDVLMSRFNEMAPAYTEIYMPWGAAHLPDIEKRLRALGYHQTEQISRPIVRFWK